MGACKTHPCRVVFYASEVLLYLQLKEGHKQVLLPLLFDTAAVIQDLNLEVKQITVALPIQL